MLTAAQIKQKTLKNITQIAEAWISDCAEPAIVEASEAGKFSATPSFEGVPSREVTASEVIRLLRSRGFEAEYVYFNGYDGYQNYILIKWGDD